MSSPKRLLAGTLAIAAVATVAGAQQQQQQVVTGPVAVYWTSAQTVSGMGAMGPGQGSAMGMAFGGSRPGQAQKTLELDLGSSRRATAAPSAEHAVPPGLKSGRSLPLVTPEARRADPVERDPETQQFERPRGRMLIYWGCGERARPGQPVVFDFSTIGTDAPMPTLSTLSVRTMQPPSASRHATYGTWPNERTRMRPPPDGSLVGDHVISGNYSPEIRFSLGQNQDFLEALTLTKNEPGPTGSVQLQWRPVPRAQAYYASVMGSDGDETMILWSSSEVQSVAFEIPDYLAPSEIERLLRQKALMTPQTTSCTVPQEVARALSEGGMLRMIALGDEANFVHPQRPSDPKIPWNIEWTAKVRYSSTYMGLLGMDLFGQGMEDGDPSGGEGEGARQPSARNILRNIPRLPGG